MGIELIVRLDDKAGERTPINIEDWRRFVRQEPDLRFREGPHVAVNPRTGVVIKIAAGCAEAEIFANGEWWPFLSYGRGRLTMKFGWGLERADDPTRVKIVALARALGASIYTDVDDEKLPWLEEAENRR